jgi:penicillin amidase
MVRWLQAGIDLAIAIAVVVGILAIIVGGALTVRAWPRMSGMTEVTGIAGDVTISRDANGIAWVEADDPHDLFFGQGWLHASERMWQMEVWRRIGQGRLSELFGESTLEFDRYTRTLGLHAAAEHDLEATTGAARAALDAYAEGVNAWLEANRDQLGLTFVVAGIGSGSGAINGLPLEPWTPADTLTFQKLQAFNLGGNLDSEIFRYLADSRLGDPARTDELFPP